MFGLVLRVISSKVEARQFVAVFGQKPWTNPWGFGSKFQICSNYFYREKEPRKDVVGCFKSDLKQSVSKVVGSNFSSKTMD